MGRDGIKHTHTNEDKGRQLESNNNSIISIAPVIMRREKIIYTLILCAAL
jgi:hypothetical protein